MKKVILALFLIVYNGFCYAQSNGGTSTLVSSTLSSEQEEDLDLPDIPEEQTTMGYEEEEKVTSKEKKSIQEELLKGILSPIPTSTAWKPTSTDFLGVLQESTVQGLKKIWNAFSIQEIKDAYKRDFEIQHLGEKADIKKGVLVTSDGYLHPSLTKEGQFISQRIRYAQQALQKFTGLKTLSYDEVPRIGCAFSGGGYRAMITTAGFLKALEDLGLLDAVLNISTLSGSTWFLGPWTFCQTEDKKISVKEYQNILIGQIRKNQFDLLPKDPTNIKFDVKSFVERVIWPKVIFSQIIGSVDIYGGALAYTLLNNASIRGTKPFALRLSNQWENVKNGNSPWPSYTAVSMHNRASEGKQPQYAYNWYEFDPAEVRNLEQNIAFQSYGFGRTFANGRSTNVAPEQSFGFIMGICGSAYAVNFKDLSRIFLGYTPSGNRKKDLTSAAYTMVGKWFKQPVNTIKKTGSTVKTIFSLAKQGKFKNIWGEVQKTSIGSIMGIVFAMLLDWIADIKIEKTITIKGIKVGEFSTTVGTVRASPAQIANPFKGYTEINQPWLTTNDYLTFVDAGIDYNIPIRPLLRPERDLDLIIIGDASDVPGLSLSLALADAKRVYGLTYTKDEKLSSKTIQVYRVDQKTYPNSDKKMVPPDIICFNFFKDDAKIREAQKRKDAMLISVINDNKLETFSEQCVKNFCGTFNFNYTEEQFKQLSGMAEFNIKDNRTLLEGLIEERAELRQAAPPEFGQ